MTVTCETVGCANEGIPIEVPEPDPEDIAGWTVVCGVCGATLHDHSLETG